VTFIVIIINSLAGGKMQKICKFSGGQIVLLTGQSCVWTVCTCHWVVICIISCY